MRAGIIKVLIVDDSAFVRLMLNGILGSDPAIEIVGCVPDPVAALARIAECKPDVIMLDIEMPRMDGLTFLQQLMERNPIPVVICSSHAEQGAHSTLKALEYGAVEIIAKPRLEAKQFFEEFRMTLRQTVKAAAEARVRPRSRVAPLKPAVDLLTSAAPKENPNQTTEKLIVIGASTGGPEALRAVLEAMPADSPPVAAVLHMPEPFTGAYARRLDGLCQVSVKEAEPNDLLIRGRAVIAPGNKHMSLKRIGGRYFVDIHDGDLVSRHRPSVDVLFRSAAQCAGPSAAGVIMSGMGDDGAHGLLKMKSAGAFTIAQDEATCVVFGMPREAIALNAANRILPLEAISEALVAWSNQKARAASFGPA